MNKSHKKFLTVPVFVAAMGVSPAIFVGEPGQAFDDATVASQMRAAPVLDQENEALKVAS